MIFVITTQSTQPRIRFLQKSLINPTTMGIKKKWEIMKKRYHRYLSSKKKLISIYPWTKTGVCMYEIVKNLREK